MFYILFRLDDENYQSEWKGKISIIKNSYLN